jgi:hypothetical protein
MNIVGLQGSTQQTIASNHEKISLLAWNNLSSVDFNASNHN